MNRKKIFLIGPIPPPVNGQSIAFQTFCEGVKEKKLNCEIINIGKDSSGRKDGTFSLMRLFYLFPAFISGLKLLFNRNCMCYLTIAQSWNGFLRDAFFIILGWLGGHAVILHLHGGNYQGFYKSQSKFKRYLILNVLKKADKIIVLGKELISCFNFLDNYKDKVKIVPNGLSFDLKDKIKKTLPLSQEKPIKLLYISNMIETKGYMDVLNAVKILHFDYKINIECDFYGKFLITQDSIKFNSPEEAKKDFLYHVKKWELEDKVHWEPNIAGAAKIKMLSQAHFFVLPSSYVNEGQPISIIEALAFGSIVISTNYRGISELLDEGRAGFFVDANFPQQIAEVILRFFKQKEDFFVWSKKSVEHFKKNFTREKYVDTLAYEIIKK